MTAAQYEQFAGQVIRQLQFLEGARVARNRRIPGVRQPGEYEVDIAVEFRIGTQLNFLLIVECKNWSRPVGRQTVQQLAQTRDAIAAHKAALVSPLGFTKQAIALAKSHGIALWVLSRTRWEVVLGIPRLTVARVLRGLARRKFLERLGLRFARFSSREPLALVDVTHAMPIIEMSRPSWIRFRHSRRTGSASSPDSGQPGFDPRLAVTQIADEIGRQASVAPPTRE